MSELLLDRAGRHRSPATMPGFHVGRPPRNKGLRYPAVPPGGGDHRGHARRRRRRARLAVARLDRDPLACRAAHPRDARTRRGGSRSAPRRCGGPSRQGRTPPRSRHGRLGMDRASAVARERVELPVGPLVCVLTGPTRGRHWSSAAARNALRRTAVATGVRRRFAPHQLRHAHAVELARERRATDRH